MLRRTVKNIRLLTGVLIAGMIGGTIFYSLTKPEMTISKNLVLSETSFFQTRGQDYVIFMLTWKEDLVSKSAGDINNYTVEQVEPDGKGWKVKENGKKCRISFAQYVYSPWLDTEEKRKKAGAQRPDESQKVTQLSVYIEPKGELNDYFRVTAKNIVSKSGKSIASEESVVRITDFNKFIKM